MLASSLIATLSSTKMSEKYYNICKKTTYKNGRILMLCTNK